MVRVSGVHQAHLERMFCHPNTIRHRLKSVTEELGRSLTDPADIAELGAALRALHMFPDTACLPAARCAN